MLLLFLAVTLLVFPLVENTFEDVADMLAREAAGD